MSSFKYNVSFQFQIDQHLHAWLQPLQMIDNIGRQDDSLFIFGPDFAFTEEGKRWRIVNGCGCNPEMSEHQM